MTYLELFECEWDDVKYNISEIDRMKLKEMSQITVKDRNELRNWCISKDRDKKLKELGL